MPLPSRPRLSLPLVKQAVKGASPEKTVDLPDFSSEGEVFNFSLPNYQLRVYASPYPGSYFLSRLKFGKPTGEVEKGLEETSSEIWSLISEEQLIGLQLLKEEGKTPQQAAMDLDLHSVTQAVPPNFGPAFISMDHFEDGSARITMLGYFGISGNIQEDARVFYSSNGDETYRWTEGNNYYEVIQDREGRIIQYRWGPDSSQFHLDVRLGEDGKPFIFRQDGILPQGAFPRMNHGSIYVPHAPYWPNSPWQGRFGFPPLENEPSSYFLVRDKMRESI
ncbi:MAG: hypothetical protein AB7G80_00525 [Dongiaceae bacterium]